MNAAIAQRAACVKASQTQGQALTVAPIEGPSHGEPAYRLLEGEALDLVRLTEVSEGGSVPQLRVENLLDERVLLMDGQELLGAKQNRILNADVLVPPQSKIALPVSCVEAGRWNMQSPTFRPGKSASHTVRRGKQERVHQALRERGEHDGGQGEVWNEVRQSLERAGASSPTAALHAAYEHRQQEMDHFRAALVMPETAVGLAVFREGEFLGLDLFDRHSTLAYFWQSLLESYAVDWLMAPPDSVGPRRSGPGHDAPTEVQRLLTEAAGGEWEAFASPGEGADWRLNHARLFGSALVFEERVVLHMQLFARDVGGGGRRPRIHRRYARGRRADQERSQP